MIFIVQRGFPVTDDTVHITNYSIAVVRYFILLKFGTVLLLYSNFKREYNGANTIVPLHPYTPTWFLDS